MRVKQLFGYDLYAGYRLPDNSTIGEQAYKYDKAIELADMALVNEQIGKGANLLKLIADDPDLEARISYALVFDMQGELLRFKHKLEVEEQKQKPKRGKVEDALQER